MTAASANPSGRHTLKPGDPITVIKQDIHGQPTWTYDGRVLQHGPGFVLLEARFNRDDTPFHGVLLGKGDRFVETFYTDRWYNIFEIHDRQDDRLKAWYCNVGYPAEINGGQVSYKDLALDLFVYPDGKQLVLDQDEFDALALAPPVKEQALQALEELKQLFKNTE